MLRSLHDGHPGIGEEKADCAVEEVAVGSKVGVKDHEQFAVGEL